MVGSSPDFARLSPCVLSKGSVPGMAEINQKGMVIKIIYGKITEINLVILVTFKLTTPSLLLTQK